MTLQEEAARAITWSIALGIAQRGIAFACTIVLARLLDPVTFGIFALATLTVDAFGLFKSLGLDTALIQRRDDVALAADTAFCIIPVVGGVLYAALALTAPLIGRMFATPELVPVLHLLGLVFVAGCFARVPAALLEKNLSFGRISWAEFASSAVFSLSALLLAVLGLGLWSLVYAYLLRTIVHLVMVWSFARWRPRLRCSLPIALDMFRFGRFHFLDTMVWFLRRNLDNAMVGWLLGLQRLGVYSLAFNLSNLLVEYFASKVVRVIHPACARIQDSLADVRTAFVRVERYVAVVAVPFGAALTLLAEDFVQIALGPKWAEVVPSLRVLTWGGVCATLAAPATAIFLGLGKPKVNLQVTLVQVALFVTLIAPASRFGLVGVSGVVSLAYLVGLVLAYARAAKTIALSAAEIVRPLKGAALIAGMTLAGCWLTRLALLEGTAVGLYSRFALEAAVGAILFAAGVYALEREAFDEGLRLLGAAPRAPRRAA